MLTQRHLFSKNFSWIQSTRYYMIDGDYYRNDIQLLYLFFFLIPHRCCRLHTRCHSTPQRHSSPCWVVWRWMTRRLQRQRCRSSRTQAARWKRVSLTSNRMFHRPIDTWSRACAITLFHQAFKKEKKKKTVVVHILGGDTCFEHAGFFMAYGNASYGL